MDKVKLAYSKVFVDFDFFFFLADRYYKVWQGSDIYEVLLKEPR